MITFVDLREKVIKKVIRGGKIKKKTFCKPGQKAQDGRCVTMKGNEKLKRAIATRKSGKKRAQKSQVAALRKRKISLRKGKVLAKRK